MIKAKKINLKVISYSIIGLIFIGLMFMVDWLFIIGAVICIGLSQRELMGKK